MFHFLPKYRSKGCINATFWPTFSQYPPDGVLAVVTEYLLEVVGHVVAGEALVAHHEVVGLLAGYLRDGGLVHVFIEAGQQVAVGYVPHRLAGYLLLLYLGRQWNTKFYHRLEEQVLVCAVGLDVVLKQVSLVEVRWGVIYVLHVRRVELQHAEAGIKVLGGQRAFLLDLLASTADALLADLADVLVASLVGLALLVRLFWQLHHDELSLATILCIELHHGMGSSGGAGEEVEDDGIIFII